MNVVAGQILVRRRGRRSSFRTAERQRRALRLGDTEWWCVFGSALALNLAMVYVVVYQLNLFVTDAMSRTLHAWQVFFSATPKLTSVGFIWPPLPTLLQLPLVLLPPLRMDGLSGNVQTAVMGAVTAVTLDQVFRLWYIQRPYRYILLALFILNPMVLFYASNGMSEMTFIFFTVLSVYCLLLWRRFAHFAYLGVLGFSVGLAFLARYDTLVHALLLVGVIWLLSREMAEPSLSKTQAMIVFYGIPVSFASGLWLLFNWMFMGDPLHFVRGEYSNAAQIGFQMALLPNIVVLTHNPVGIVVFIVEEVALLFPAFLIGIALLVGDFLFTKNRLAFSLAILALSFPVFQAMNMFEGQSAAFLRYFILAIPYGFILIAFLMFRTRSASRILTHGIRLVAVLLLVASSIATGWSMARASEWGQWNDIFLRALLRQERVDTWDEERDIAQYLLSNTDGRGVLVDDFQGYRIVFFTGKPWLFVATGDDDFKEVLRAPMGKVKYILASPTSLEGVLNQVNKQYPSLYAHGAEWATLEKEWPKLGWRLYRVAGYDSAGGDAS